MLRALGGYFVCKITLASVDPGPGYVERVRALVSTRRDRALGDFHMPISIRSELK